MKRLGLLPKLIIAIILGMGMALLKEKTMYNFFSEFQKIVQMVIELVIIPLLPYHIAGIFANISIPASNKKIL